jgi:hypothetical protein
VWEDGSDPEYLKHKEQELGFVKWAERTV